MRRLGPSRNVKQRGLDYEGVAFNVLMFITWAPFALEVSNALSRGRAWTVVVSLLLKSVATALLARPVLFRDKG